MVQKCFVSWGFVLFLMTTQRPRLSCDQHLPCLYSHFSIFLCLCLQHTYLHWNADIRLMHRPCDFKSQIQYSFISTFQLSFLFWQPHLVSCQCLHPVIDKALLHLHSVLAPENILNYLFLIMYVCLPEYVPCLCIACRAQKSPQSPGSWSCRWLWAGSCEL